MEITPLMVYQTYEHERKQGTKEIMKRVGRRYGRSDEWARKKVREYEASLEVDDTLAYEPPPEALPIPIVPTVAPTEDQTTPTEPLEVMSSPNSDWRPWPQEPIPFNPNYQPKQFDRDVRRIMRTRQLSIKEIMEQDRRFYRPPSWFGQLSWMHYVAVFLRPGIPLALVLAWILIWFSFFFG